MPPHLKDEADRRVPPARQPEPQHERVMRERNPDIRTWEHLRLRRALGRAETAWALIGLLAPWLGPQPERGPA